METLKDMDLVRAVETTPVFVRANVANAGGADTGTQNDGTEVLGSMTVDFSTFNTWYEIDSWFEGQFLERTVPGSFKKTIKENGDNVKVLYDHGMDYQVGNKILGSIESLAETSTGPHADVSLFDTSYNRDLLPGLKAGVYGSSFRFRVIKEEWNDEPGVSSWNPKGIPERTIKEVKLMEFGPVTFPANPDSTAGVRSLTDDFYNRARQRDPHVYDDLVARATALRTPEAVEDDTSVEAEKDTRKRAVDVVDDEPVVDHSELESQTTHIAIPSVRVRNKARYMRDYMAIITKGNQDDD